MFSDIMAILLQEDSKILEVWIHSLMMAPYSCLHFQILWQVAKLWWTLHMPRVSTVALIGFNTLSPLKERLQQRFKIFDVRPLPTWKRAINLVDVASQNAQANFIAESRFTLELVWRQGATMIWNTNISAINTDITVMVWINDPVIKFDLIRVFRCWKAMKNELKGGYNKTYHHLFECCNCWDKWQDVFLSSLWVNNSFQPTNTWTQKPLLWMNFEKYKVQSMWSIVPSSGRKSTLLSSSQKTTAVITPTPKKSQNLHSSEIVESNFLPVQFAQPCHRCRNQWEGNDCPFSVCWTTLVLCLLMTSLHQEDKEGVVGCWGMDAKWQKIFYGSHPSSKHDRASTNTLRGLSSLLLTQVLYNT